MRPLHLRSGRDRGQGPSAYSHCLPAYLSKKSFPKLHEPAFGVDMGHDRAADEQAARCPGLLRRRGFPPLWLF